MNSLVYFYSKFTEEFLLLSAAGVFTLLSIYCYHWVIQKRRLGVARSQIPSAVVKSYLSQLINEAEFVRKQLFGMTDGNTYVPTPGFTGAAFTAPSAEGHQTLSPDLIARVNALESQLKEKEGLVVNINIEKTKLLEEIEKMKTNPNAAPAAGSGNQDQLTQKIKNLEARLEEYALFEEDLANLKRLQQENTQLKKQIGDLGSNPDTAINIPASPKAEPTERKPLAAVPDIQPEKTAPAAEKETAKHALDPAAIDNLLNGAPATPPNEPEAAAPAASAAPTPEAAPAENKLPPLDDVLPPGFAVDPGTSTAPSDQFEKLVDSVENSLEIPNLDEPAVIPATPEVPEKDKTIAAAPKAEMQAAEAGPAPESPLANKTDEELLKEFENLLNS